MITEEDKNQHNEISTSTNNLNEVETEDEKDKNDKITLEDLTNIISEPDDKKDDEDHDYGHENDHDHNHENGHDHDLQYEKDNENEHDNEHAVHIKKKDSADLSNDDMIESELRMIRKKNLDKYVLFNNKFKSNTESEEELSKQSQNDNLSQRQLNYFFRYISNFMEESRFSNASFRTCMFLDIFYILYTLLIM
jgi:ABC-type Zn2+ transport system substrate-binding protein/surface adhesin